MKHLTALFVFLGILIGFSQGWGQDSTHMQHMEPKAPGTAGGIPHATNAPQDPRELVRFPEPMQEHMLGNMRDHLATLNEIIGDIAEGKFDAAAKLAEQRLGMSSLSLHDAAHMAPFMPKPMQDMGTSMHRAGSRLVIVLQDASITPSLQSMQDINRALHEVTSACTGCHAAYRIR